MGDSDNGSGSGRRLGSSLESGHVFSDSRLKHRISRLKNNVEKLERIRGLTFEYTEEAQTSHGLGAGVQMGFLAQEIQEVLPEVVETTNDGFLTVNYPAMSAYLVEVVKEQQAEISLMQASIDKLFMLFAVLSAVLFCGFLMIVFWVSTRFSAVRSVMRRNVKFTFSHLSEIRTVPRAVFC